MDVIPASRFQQSGENHQIGRIAECRRGFGCAGMEICSRIGAWAKESSGEARVYPDVRPLGDWDFAVLLN